MKLRILAIVGILAMSITLSVEAQHMVTHEQEPNDVPAQANPVRIGNGVTGEALLGDVDYFKVETPGYLARYRVGINIYTPHPPLGCTVTVAVRGSAGPNQIIYEGVAIDYDLDWTGLGPTSYYIGISSDCSELHYQLDFSKVRGPYHTYVPITRRRVGGW